VNQAARERKALGQLISELLGKAMASEDETTAPTPLTWVGKDLDPGVDLEDKDALWSMLDER
jgi:hypothetical protein